MSEPHRFPGRAPSVLALHGFLGSGLDFEALHPHLALGIEAPDLLPLAYGHAGMPDAAATLLGGPPRVLLGYSMGARFALHLAVADPSAFLALILVSGTAGLADAYDRDERRRADGAWVELLEREGLDAFLAAWDAQPILAGHRRIPEPFRGRALARRRELEPALVAKALRAFGTGATMPLWDALRRVTLPTLLLTGAEDRKYGQLATELARGLPDAQHVEVSDAGHAVHLERPHEVASAIEGFLLARGLV
jgi:2-succinyl-6-hydroxy-2,4-cyclohexadiene-1-carboxylate synthase